MTFVSSLQMHKLKLVFDLLMRHTLAIELNSLKLLKPKNLVLSLDLEFYI